MSNKVYLLHYIFYDDTQDYGIVDSEELAKNWVEEQNTKWRKSHNPAFQEKSPYQHTEFELNKVRQT